jgi:gas vesicle protein
MADYENNEEYESSERNSVGLAVTFLLIGLGAGALLGLLFAPKSGRQMRRTLKRRYEDARGVIEDLGDQAGDIFEKGAEWANVAKEKVAPLGKVMGRRR